MSDSDKNSASSKVTRRDVTMKIAVAAYVVPAVLGAIKATERPAYAETTGIHGLPPQPSEF